MRGGLTEEVWERLRQIFAQYAAIERVVLFGSRAKGMQKPFSDVDLALFGEGLNRDMLCRLLLQIDDLLLPYEFGLCIFHSLENPDLIDHIRRVGIIVYQK